MSNAVLKGNAGGTGTVTLETPNTNSDLTISLPAATGTVMVSGNMPAFSAYLSAGQTVSNATDTKVQFNTKVWDTSSSYDNTTNYRYTPNVAGYYQVTACVTWGFTSGATLTKIYKNGSLYVLGQFAAGTSIGAAANVTAIVNMNGTTDYIEIYTYQLTGSSNAITNASYGTYFQASMVRTAS